MPRSTLIAPLCFFSWVAPLPPTPTGLSASLMLRLSRGCRGARVEALAGRLLRRDLPAGAEQPAGMRVVGRPVHRFDAGEVTAAIAEHRKRAAFDRAARHRAVEPIGQSGDLQPLFALLAPEPRQRGVGVRLADDPVGDAAGVVG